MAKDPRYRTVKNQILSKHIKTLDEIFVNDTQKKSVVARDLKISLDRWDKKMDDINRFRMEELTKLAALLEVELIEVLTLVANQYTIQQKRKPKK